MNGDSQIEDSDFWNISKNESDYSEDIKIVDYMGISSDKTSKVLTIINFLIFSYVQTFIILFIF